MYENIENEVTINGFEITFINEDIINISDGMKSSFKIKKNILKKVELEIIEENDFVCIKS